MKVLNKNNIKLQLLINKRKILKDLWIDRKTVVKINISITILKTVSVQKNGLSIIIDNTENIGDRNGSEFYGGNNFSYNHQC